MSERQLKNYVDEFQKKGFVHIRAVLTAGEIASFGAAVDRAVALRKRNDWRRFEERSVYEQSFIQCQFLWEDFPDVRPLTFHPRITALAAALIGADRLRLWHDQALYKEAGGRETDAHQDLAYWPIAEDDILTVWIPFEGADERSGCMGYYAGSHRGECVFIDMFNSPGSGKTLERKFGDTKPIYVPCGSGDVIFHHGRTAHLAMANRSERTRRVYTAIYFRDGLTRGGGFERRHPCVDRDQIAPGQRIGGPATPIAWPLPDGQLPQPAPWPQANDERNAFLRRIGAYPEGGG